MVHGTTELVSVADLTNAILEVHCSSSSNPCHPADPFQSFMIYPSREKERERALDSPMMGPLYAISYLWHTMLGLPRLEYIHSL